VHQDTGIWGPDAASFRPERWLDEAYMARVPQYAYLPFRWAPPAVVVHPLL
jgi:cytochrome P450